jgi:hypothetical protein
MRPVASRIAADSADATYTSDSADATYTSDSADATYTSDSAHATYAANTTHATYAATADVRIAIEIVVVVDVNVIATPATTPAPTAAPKRSHHHSDAEGDRHARGVVTPGRIVNRRIRIHRGTVDYYGIIRRYVYDLRIGLFDHDYALVFYDLCFHFLLLGGLQSAFVLCFPTHALNSVHDVALLCQKGVAEISGPLNVVCQPFGDFGQSRESLNARIPGLFRHCISKRFILQILILFKPLLKQDDLERIRGCSQSLGEQGVWIKRNWRYQGIQLLRWNRGRLGL